MNPFTTLSVLSLIFLSPFAFGKNYVLTCYVTGQTQAHGLWDYRIVADYTDGNDHVLSHIKERLKYATQNAPSFEVKSDDMFTPKDLGVMNSWIEYSLPSGSRLYLKKNFKNTDFDKEIDGELVLSEQIAVAGQFKKDDLRCIPSAKQY